MTSRPPHRRGRRYRLRRHRTPRRGPAPYLCRDPTASRRQSLCSAPPKRPGRGRPPVKGTRLPKLTQLLHDPTTIWHPHTVPLWYDQPTAASRSPAHRRMDHTGKLPVPIRWLLVRDPTGEPQAFLATDLEAAPADVLQWFVSRWQVEVTFQETRAHLGVETKRQWSDLAILRTTPALLGLFSLVTLWAHDLAHIIPSRRGPLPGIQSPTSPLAMPSPLCAAKAGRSKFPSRPGNGETLKIPREVSRTVWQTLSPTPALFDEVELSSCSTRPGDRGFHRDR